MDAKHLKIIEVSEVDFYSFVDKLKGITKVVDNVTEYFYGYKYCPTPDYPKRKCVYGKYNGTEYLVMPNYRYDYRCANTYVQIILQKNISLRKSETGKCYSGTYCYNTVMKMVKKYYKDDEIEAIFNSHAVFFDAQYKQVHINYNVLTPFIGKYIYQFDNCVKYDINGAHCDALCELFPKCRKDFNALYLKRKEKPELKQLFNFCVGSMKNKGHEPTYWWIVKRTTDILNKAMKEVGGKVIYANTDGFAVQNPIKKLNTSKELGDFKLEYEGTVYFHQANNYFLYQFGDDLKGNCPVDLRNRIDLAKGKAITFDIVRTSIDCANEKKMYNTTYENIEGHELKLCRK